MSIEAIKGISIEYFLKTDIGVELKKVMAVYEQIQKEAEAFKSSDEKSELVKLRIGSVLTLGVLSRISKGKWPKDYSKDDWYALVSEVSEYAVDIDGQEYSALIFKLYAEYIDVSAGIFTGMVPAEKLDAIRNLADELRQKTELFQNDGIGESEYTEDCLWICLDAMTKLLSAAITKYAGSDFGQLAEGIASVAFEYGRLVLYQKEQRLLNQYIENQHVIDVELQKQFDDYLRELQAQADTYEVLIDNAFSADFRQALQGSVELAIATGVSQNEILKTQDEIDDFFLN